MCATFKIIILALCLSLVNGEVGKHSAKQFIIQNRLSDKGLVNSGASAFRSGDQSLMQFMIEARSLSDNNPQRSVECFNYYTPILSGITDDYESDYAACIIHTDARKANIDNETQPQRTEIEAAAAKSCELLSTCSENKNSITYFECYASEGSANSKAMYAISAHASEVLVEVREKYRVIEFEESRCTNTAERKYLTSSSSTYEELQSCLRGLTPVPTTTQSPTTTTPEVTTTPEIIVETTTKIFTDVPATTTEAVEITTTITGETTTAEDSSEGSDSTPEPATTEASGEDTTESGENSETTAESITTTVVYNPVPPSAEPTEVTTDSSANSEENNQSNERENSKENGKSNEKSNESKNSNESQHESQEKSNPNEKSSEQQINSAAKKLEELRKQLQLRREQNELKKQNIMDKINEKVSYFGNSESKYRF